MAKKSLKNKDKTKMTSRERSNANLNPCKKGETHNPNGRPKGGRSQALEVLDSFLAEKKSKEALKVAFRKEFYKNPIRFFERIVMPLVPKDINLNPPTDFTFIIGKSYKPKIKGKGKEMRKLFKTIISFYAWLICEILQSLDYDDVIAHKWHFLVCDPCTLWAWGKCGFRERFIHGYRLLYAKDKSE